MEKINENNPETKYRLGVISDTQERKGSGITEALKPLRQLEDDGVKLDFITHIGDLSGVGSISKYVKEAKQLATRYDKEKSGVEVSQEMEQYDLTIKSPEYQQFASDLKNKGVEQNIVIYALWSAKQRGEFEQALNDMEQQIKDVVDELQEFKSEVKHIMGNADRAFPEKLEATQKLLNEQSIISYDRPLHLSLDEKTSVVFWPSMKVDENNKEQIRELHETIDQFSKLMRNKQSILIFAHETPFKGPMKPGVYEKRVKDVGLKGSERVPYKQFLPVSRFVMELARRLPADAKIAMTAGHMHVPRETIEAGTQYIKFDEKGKAKMRLFGLGGKIDQNKYETIPGGKRTIDLYYLSEGEVGTFEIKEDGTIQYNKLSKDKEYNKKTIPRSLVQSFFEEKWEETAKLNNESVYKSYENPGAEIFTNTIINNEGKSVLDLGCGDGRFALKYASDGLQVTAVDFSSEAIKRTLDRAKWLDISERVKCEINDIKKFSSSEKFDGISCNNILHYFTDEEINLIVEKMQNMTNYNGLNYIVFESDIKMSLPNGEEFSFEEQEHRSAEEITKLLKELYKEWEVIHESKRPETIDPYLPPIVRQHLKTEANTYKRKFEAIDLVFMKKSRITKE
ncbi:MAG: class I SAM-dependent methyltransferase [Patescibacteria group bacterium]